MNRLTTALVTATLFTASLVHAELKYVAYNLDSKTANNVTVTESDLRSDTYRTGSEMLFVQDTDVSTEYYIGVFEVTVAQARKLGWKSATTSGEAYATSSTAESYQFSNADHPLCTALTFPTVAQWQAYADATVKYRDNIRWDGNWPLILSDWYNVSSDPDEESTYEDEYYMSITIAQNSHGVFDIFGNVAEYTTDAHLFYGGFAAESCIPTTVNKTTCDTAANISKLGTLLGARLIYTPQTMQSYTVKVTLNGETLSTASYPSGATVTIEPPTVDDGLQLNCTITPATITGTTFTMPESDVTFAYTTEPVLYIQVVGGTSDKTEVFQNDTITLTPTAGDYQIFKSWTLPDGSTAETEELSVTFDDTLFAAYEAGTTLTYTAVFNTYPQVSVKNGTVTHNPETGESLGEGYYTPGTVLTLTADTKENYIFSSWKSSASDTPVTGSTIVVGDWNSSVTFTPVYTPAGAQADLTYLAYNLDTKTAREVTVTDVDLRSDTYRTGSEMLFVQNAANSVEYYIGVFEVTVAQARKLGWTNVTASGEAYATTSSVSNYKFGDIHRLTNFVDLTFPTVLQWQAYADATVKSRDNIRWGGDWPFTLTTWYDCNINSDTASNDNIQIAPNTHGVFDIFGNVAEYTTDAHMFYGGFASESCIAADRTTCYIAAEIANLTDTNNSLLGARLVYTPPEYQSFSVTVTLDGDTVSTATYKPGTSVTVTPPTVADGLQMSCTVTPETITGTTFTMPEAHVTFAYTTTKFLRIQVVGGTSDKTEIFQNDTVTLTPTPGTYEVFKNWTLPNGTTSETETLSITFDDALFAAYEPGETVTCTATFNTCPRVIINDGSATHNPETGESLGEGYYTPDTEITLTADKKPGYKFTAWQKDAEEETTTESTYIVGDYNTVVTFTPVYTPSLTIRVVGGTASQSEVIVGDTVTLTPTPNTYQSFRSWTLPDGTTSSIANPSFTIDQSYFETYEAGDTLTCTAAFNTYPRVLVYGGSVTYNNDSALGEGYYKPGTSLGLRAHEIEGYTFEKWLKNGEDHTGTTYFIENNTYNITITFTPVYTISTPEATGAVTRIGEVQTGETYTSKLELGYVEESPATHEVNSNTFVYYPAVLTDKPYLVLDTAKKELVYADTVPGDAKTASPTLKRIALTGEQPEQPYYVGIYETTIGHFTNVEHATDPNATVDEDAAASAYPQVYARSTDAFHTQYFANIKEAFGVEMSLPTYTQIEGITKSGLGKKETFTGAGFYNTARGYGDPKITSDMIYNGQSGAWHYYGEVGTCTSDPYGFYDLWGNVLEMIADGKLRGGHCGSPTALCNLKIDTDSYPSSFPGAFRPAVTVKPQVTVTIATLGESLKVFPGQVINLAEQVAPNARFTGWTATVGDTTTIVEKDTATDVYPYTVEADVTLTPTFNTDIPTVALTYENCFGPETALPGSTTQIYAENPGYKLLALTLEPANAGTVNLATGTVTLDAAAIGEVTVKATYDTPKASGYILKLK